MLILKQIGHELGARYVLEGSVQRGGNRMRVNAQLNAMAFIAPSMGQSCATGYLLCDDYGLPFPTLTSRATCWVQ